MAVIVSQSRRVEPRTKKQVAEEVLARAEKLASILVARDAASCTIPLCRGYDVLHDIKGKHA